MIHYLIAMISIPLHTSRIAAAALLISLCMTIPDLLNAFK